MKSASDTYKLRCALMTNTHISVTSNEGLILAFVTCQLKSAVDSVSYHHVFNLVPEADEAAHVWGTASDHCRGKEHYQRLPVSSLKCSTPEVTPVISAHDALARAGHVDPEASPVPGRGGVSIIIRT